MVIGRCFEFVLLDMMGGRGRRLLESEGRERLWGRSSWKWLCVAQRSIGGGRVGSGGRGR